jgi:hydroxypyruvate isomerase
MARFAANLSMMFTEHPFLDRFDAAARAGFRAVEFLFPYAHSPQEVAAAAGDAGLELALFNMPPGDWDAGERGMACIPGRDQEFDAGIDTAIEYALALRCPRLHCMAGLCPQGVSQAEMDALYRERLGRAARRAGERGLTVLMEPINPIDMPGFYLADFDQGIAILDGFQGEHRPRLQFDIYHCARIHGDVARRIDASAAYIDHFQIAGPKARNEPDDGELDLAAVLAAVERITPARWVGCEYRPAGRTEDGLAWMAPYAT